MCSKSKESLSEWNSSCLFLCFYHRLTGVVKIPRTFWRRSLSNELNYWKENPTLIDDRLFEHVEGFDRYKTVPFEIESIVEIGAGPFTQVQYLLNPTRSIKRISLVEPNALEYLKLNNCAYRGGHLRGFPVEIFPQPIEDFIRIDRERNSSERFDLLISINVVEHVENALEYFRALHFLIRDGGFIVFHERWFEVPREADCALGSPEFLHPIRITKWIVDEFTQLFEPIFVNFNKTKRQIFSPCLERGIYFIGKKKKLSS